jgi:hypothetical protein
MYLRASMTALLACSCAVAAPPQQSAATQTHEFTVWVPKHLEFLYRHATTQYTCSGLQTRMKSLLLELGARPDLDVREYGCTQLSGPDPLAGVKINMNVLEPAGQRPGLSAHWQRVDLLANRELLEAAADCELIQEIQQKILPLFTVRNVDYSAACEARKLLPGATRLKADVLVPDQPPSAGSVGR